MYGEALKIKEIVFNVILKPEIIKNLTIYQDKYLLLQIVTMLFEQFWIFLSSGGQLSIEVDQKSNKDLFYVCIT